MDTRAQSFFVRHKTLFIINFSVFIIFFGLATLVTHGGTGFDQSFQAFAVSIRSAVLSPIMFTLTNVFQPAVLLAVALIIALTLFYKKQRVWALFFFVSIVGALISVEIFKNVFAIARPQNHMIVESGWSFPSGHATGVSVFFYMTLYAVYKYVRQKVATFFIFVLALTIVIGVCFSRLYLGVHYLSDIFAGISLGTFWATMSILLLERSLESQSNSQIFLANR
jgi:undecaprenyl-diphosphatase